tara:strand:- start:1167 stop:1943 length:777 start_codon:yes stop_codon:yes gene_type:complete
MTDVFAKHNIGHLSASTINSWIQQPALCLLKLGGFSDGEAGASAWRGSSVDRAVTKAAFNPDMKVDDLINLAHKVFDDSHKKSINTHDAEKVAKERKAIVDYVKQGAQFYRGLGEQPESEQGKVVVRIGDIETPFVGYYDLLYKDKVRDTKTVGRQVSQLAQTASRQASIYALGTGCEPWIDYVTTKEVRAYRVERVDYWLRQVELASKSLERVLSHSDDIVECCQLVYPDLDHWMWSDTNKRIAKDIWQMENHDAIR